MTALLTGPPYGERDEAQLLSELEELTRHHLAHCPEFGRIWAGWLPGGGLEGIPYLHVGLFKRLLLRSEGVEHQRVLLSSGTNGSPSQVVLDSRSAELQARSSSRILTDFLGEEVVPLLVLDHVSALRSRMVSARIAAAMSLRPLASEVTFLLSRPDDPTSVRWDVVADIAARSSHLRVYGFTSLLWLAWAQARNPLGQALSRVRVDFVHSGGWKKLESLSVGPDTFNAELLAPSGPGSRVVDFYGLVEQVGVVFPLCEAGARHVPAWAAVIVRDPVTLRSLPGEIGMLQLLNVLAWGSPNYSVLTEDVGRLLPGDCPCGRKGSRFELAGRIPKAELRGCANV